MENEQSDFEKDELILAQLKTQAHSGLTTRSKNAIKELAELGQGASIFLFLAMNQRIIDLECQIKNMTESAKKNQTIN